MSVDYRQQYTPEQLEPFWPNETIRMMIVTLCTVAVIAVLAVAPVLLDLWGLGHWLEEPDPANPRMTPADIHPEWYFLAVYQSLKLAPQELLGVSGRTIGVLSQGVLVLAVLFVPFWARRWSGGHPGIVHRLVVTLAIVVFVGLTLWASWPPGVPMMTLVCSAVVLFYILLARERRMIRRVLHGGREAVTK